MSHPARSSVFQEVASAIGRESARKLIEAFGGTALFVPKTIGPKHPIAKAIGAEAAKLLSTYFHGTELALPVSRIRREQVKSLGGELTRQQIALKTGYSERQVYRILGNQADPSQGDLFSGESGD